MPHQDEGRGTGGVPHHLISQPRCGTSRSFGGGQSVAGAHSPVFVNPPRRFPEPVNATGVGFAGAFSRPTRSSAPGSGIGVGVAIQARAPTNSPVPAFSQEQRDAMRMAVAGGSSLRGATAELGGSHETVRAVVHPPATRGMGV